MREERSTITEPRNPNPTATWPHQATMIALEEIDSTSDHAARLAREGQPDPPFVVWARKQTRGRGQRSNPWWSDAGSLTFTLALDPLAHRLGRGQEPRLALTTAVAVIEAIYQLDLAAPGLGIRWPNDIEFRGRKLGGILPESVETTHGRRILLGVGLNLSSRLDHAPDDVRTMATNLETTLGRPLKAEHTPRLVAAILIQIEQALPLLARDDPSLAGRWRSLDLLLDQWIVIEQQETRIEGLGRGIDDDGALLVEGARGVERVLAGRVLRR